MNRIGFAMVLCITFTPFAGSFSHFPIGVARPSSAPRHAQMARATRHGSILLAAQALSSSSTVERTMTSNKESVQTQAQDKQREFELNRGLAVDTLLADYSSMFDSTPMDFDIYHERILLRDNQGFSLEGKPSYKLFFKTVTNLLNLVFTGAHTSVVLMDKYGIDKSRIKMRWRIELESRLRPKSWKQLFGLIDRDGDGILSQRELNDFKQKEHREGTTWRKAETSDSRLVLEGISEYKLDAKGLIYEHIISVTYPAAPFSLAPLQELLPIRRMAHPGLAGVAGITTVPASATLHTFQPLTLFTAAAERTVIPVLPLLSIKDTAEATAGAVLLMASQKRNQGEGFFESLLPQDLKKKMPKTCQSDYDCNPGGYNFPLICADFIVARFCIDPDDWKGGGLGAHAWDLDNMEQMIKEPIPVRPDDGYGGPRIGDRSRY